MMTPSSSLWSPMSNNSALVVILAFLAFISLGLPDGLLGVAWPFIRADYDQPLDAAGLLVLTGTCGFAVSSFLNGWVRSHVGLGQLIAGCCLMMSAALAGYTLAPDWHYLILCSTTIGIAAGSIDPAVNGYVARHHGARLMQWLHACFGIGVTAGPMVMTIALAMTGQWAVGYWILAGVQACLGLLFFSTRRHWITNEVATSAADAAIGRAPAVGSTLTEALRTPSVLVGLILFFLYTGMEISVALWSFSLLTEIRGFSAAFAGGLVTVYWATFTAGRVIAGFATPYLSTSLIMLASLGVALAGSLLYLIDAHPAWSIIAIILLGLGYAPLYPAMMTTTLQRVGPRHFRHAMGLQVSAGSAGVAILPGALGILSQEYSLQVVPWLLLALCMLFFGITAWYGLLRPLAESRAGLADDTLQP